MAQTLNIESLKIKEREGIHINGGTITTSFRAASAFPGGRLRARYFLHESDHYVFSETSRVAGNPLQAELAEEDVSANPHERELRIQKTAGGERLLKLEIELLVEEMDGGEVVGDGGVPQSFIVPIEGRVAQLLDETGHSHAEFADHIEVSTGTVGKMNRGETVSAETVAQLPRSIEAHQEAQAKPKSKAKIKRKKK